MYSYKGDWKKSGLIYKLKCMYKIICDAREKKIM